MQPLAAHLAPRNPDDVLLLTDRGCGVYGLSSLHEALRALRREDTGHSALVFLAGRPEIPHEIEGAIRT